MLKWDQGACKVYIKDIGSVMRVQKFKLDNLQLETHKLTLETFVMLDQKAKSINLEPLSGGLEISLKERLKLSCVLRILTSAPKAPCSNRRPITINMVPKTDPATECEDRTREAQVLPLTDEYFINAKHNYTCMSMQCLS